MAVLSPAYLDSAHGEAEWRAFYANDPAGERGQLLPVRVGHVDPPGLLKTRVYVDLVGQGAAAAKAALLAAARGVRAKPTREPEFPGGRPQTPADTRSPRFPGPSLPVWNVPYRQNPDFIGREVALETLGRGRRPKTGASHIQVIHGMGGIGKTTLAVEYAYRHRDSFEVVWWVRAAEPATLVGDYAQLADTLGLAEHARAEQHLTVAAVRRWLEHHDRWLLILDNADDPQMTTGLQPPLAQLIDLLPQTGSGQLVVATRDASWDREVDLIELELLTAGEGVQFLLTRAGSNDRSAAAEVAVLLGHLPLAMEQAGAYVRSTRISLAAYLDRLRQFPALTLTKGRARGPGSAETVATTWQVSLDRVYRLPEAAALLELCVF